MLVLENEYVMLRQLVAKDYENLLHFALHEPEIWKFSLVSGAGAEGLRNYLDIALKEQERGTALPFIVYDKVQLAYAGSTRFYDIQPANNMLQLGYTWYGSAFQGTKVNKSCKLLLLEYAFETMGMQRVEFRADNKNHRSVAAMKSIGCTVEGVLRSNMPSPMGGRRDSIVLSVLKEEWEGGVKEQLRKKI